MCESGTPPPPLGTHLFLLTRINMFFTGAEGLYRIRVSQVQLCNCVRCVANLPEFVLPDDCNVLFTVYKKPLSVTRPPYESLPQTERTTITTLPMSPLPFTVVEMMEPHDILPSVINKSVPLHSGLCTWGVYRDQFPVVTRYSWSLGTCIPKMHSLSVVLVVQT